MKIRIAAVGRMKQGPECMLFARYCLQASHNAGPLGLSGPELIEVPESRARHVKARQMEEAQKLAGKCPEEAFKIVLDEKGRCWSSQKFAHFIRDKRQDGVKQMWFFVGGADGHGEALAERADLALSFGAMTWPHQLARILLAEQIYRATAILAGHPYHRSLRSIKSG